MLTPALIVSALALVFTVSSFWWIHARQGRLRSYAPQFFAAAATSDLLRLRFPLVLHNTGAKPIVVLDLRLELDLNETPRAVHVPWVTTRSQLKPTSDDNHAFPASFAIQGRQAEQLFIEFGMESKAFTLEQKTYVAKLSARLGHRQRWKTILKFDFRADAIIHPGQYITYTNKQVE